MTRDRIDAYLDDLVDRLNGTSGERRRMLSDAEAHLRDSADAFQRDGMPPGVAQSAAIAAFGQSPTIAQAANRRSPRAMITAIVSAAAQLCVYGFAAIGVATLLTRGLALVTSTQWVYGAPGGYNFTAAQCAHWMSLHPGANSCATAAAMENSADSFPFILAAAIIGLAVTGVVLGVMHLARRRPGQVESRLPRSTVSAIGATAFIGAGLALLAAGAANGMTRGIWGQGMLYTDGAVALIIGIAFGVRFLTRVRPVSTEPAT